MPAIDPTWLPRENGAVLGTWFLVLRYSLEHSAAGVWFEKGVNREPMLGRQVAHLAVVMNDVLCAVRVEDGLCVPSLDEVRDELVARLIELEAAEPGLERGVIEALGRAASSPVELPVTPASDTGGGLLDEIEDLKTKKDALAFAELHKVEGLDDSMKLRDMKAALVAAVTKVELPVTPASDTGGTGEEPKAD